MLSGLNSVQSDKIALKVVQFRFLKKILKNLLTNMRVSVKIYKLSHETRRAHLENYIVQSEKTKRDSFEERETSSRSSTA